MKWELTERNGSGASHMRWALEEHEYLDLAAMAGRGVPLAAAAEHLGTSLMQLQKIIARDEKAQLAWSRGRAMLEEELTGTLVKRGRDGSDSCLIFALKSMFGYSDRGPEPRQVFHHHRVMIEMPRALDAEQFQQLDDGMTIDVVPECDGGSG